MLVNRCGCVVVSWSDATMMTTYIIIFNGVASVKKFLYCFKKFGYMSSEAVVRGIACVHLV